MHDVFARLGARGLHAPHGYLRVAVVNQARSRLRQRVAERRGVTRLAAHQARAAPAAPGEAPSYPELMSAIRVLPDRQRDVVILRYYLDWSVDMIADALRISSGAVQGSLQRAITSLRNSNTTNAIRGEAGEN